ncbi:MAG: hypothetical protein ACK4P1_05355 [Aggregatilineales bacterium]
MTTTAQPSEVAYLSAAPVVRRARKNRTQEAIFFGAMLIFTLIWLIPMFSALYTSIRVQGDLTRNGFWSLPSEINFGNFATAWERGRVGTYLGNSFIITIPSLIGMLFLSSLAAYALARTSSRATCCCTSCSWQARCCPSRFCCCPSST